jgi:hypothetical protein
VGFAAGVVELPVEELADPSVDSGSAAVAVASSSPPTSLSPDVAVDVALRVVVLVRDVAVAAVAEVLRVVVEVLSSSRPSWHRPSAVHV